MTLEALRALDVAGDTVEIVLVLSQRATKVVCRIDLVGIEAYTLSVADKRGAVKYWSGFVDGLIEVARCLPVTVGDYSVTIKGGVLLAEGTVRTVAEERAALTAALVANATAASAAQAQVLLLADVPSMVDCLIDERAVLEARLAALPAA